MQEKVLIVGKNGGWNLEGSYARAFEKLDWGVFFWEPEKALHRASRGRRFGRIFSGFVYVEAWARKANLELLQLADKVRPDIILIIGTSGLRAGTLAQIKIRLPSTKAFCVYADSPHNLDTERLLCLPLFDLVTVSSPAWRESMKSLGAKNVEYLPFAADTDIHRPLDVASMNGHLAHDVAFIGNWRIEREEILEQLVDFDLCVWGEQMWRSKTRPGSPLKPRWGGRAVTDTEFSLVCAQSRILLNIMDPVTWPGPNMRTFEQPACRAFSLTTRTPAVLELFNEGTNIECFGSVEEARDKINFYLVNPDARQRIAEASHDFVLRSGHTYLDRAKQLITWARSGEAGA